MWVRTKKKGLGTIGQSAGLTTERGLKVKSSLGLRKRANSWRHLVFETISLCLLHDHGVLVLNGQLSSTTDFIFDRNHRRPKMSGRIIVQLWNLKIKLA